MFEGAGPIWQKASLETLEAELQHRLKQIARTRNRRQGFEGTPETGDEYVNDRTQRRTKYEVTLRRTSTGEEQSGQSSQLMRRPLAKRQSGERATL